VKISHYMLEYFDKSQLNLLNLVATNSYLEVLDFESLIYFVLPCNILSRVSISKSFSSAFLHMTSQISMPNSNVFFERLYH
jgi:hypothetical protein